MIERDNFFQWQAQALGGLMGWGTANVLVGAPLVCSDEQVTRQVARQAVAWGLIDLLIAVLGRRGARRQGQATTGGESNRAPAHFQRIVAINVVLDIGYVLGGAWLVRRAGQRDDRRGIGLGIMVQGSFLGCYDTLLLRGVARWVHPVSTS